MESKFNPVPIDVTPEFSTEITGEIGGASWTLTVILISSVPSPPPTGLSVLSTIRTNS